jgi:uncharacterized protein (TIGR03086 family)
VVTSDLSRIRSLQARAVNMSNDVVQHATTDDLSRPTPCADWTFADLLAHMIAQHRGFAAAASGRRTEVASWAPRPLSSQPFAEYADAAGEVIGAYADEAVADREIWLPELTTARSFSAGDAMSFHFIDYVVHSWDVARAIDVSLTIDDDVLDAALTVALRVPTDPARRGPGFAFGPALPAADTDAPLDRALAALGRAPTWPT